MRSFRTSIFVATAVAALSWAGVSRAEDDVSNKKGTTKSQSTSTTKSGSSAADSSSSSTPSTGSDSTSGTTGTTTTAPSDTTAPTTTPSTSTDSSWGTGSDSAHGTGYGSTYTTTPADTSAQQYQPAQQQPQQTQTTYSTTTTTAANYDPNAGAERRDGWIYRPNRPLLATGLGIFAGTYATSAIVGAQSDRDEDKRLYIPVVGPWLDLGQRDVGLGDGGQTEDWNQALLIGSGVLQGVGVSLAVASLFVKETDDAPRSGAAARVKSTAAAKPSVKVLPINVRGGGGFGAVGTF